MENVQETLPRYGYFVVFFGTDGERDEYQYTDLKSAKHHFNQYRFDDSGYYTAIELIRYEWATRKEEILDAIQPEYY